MIDPMKDEDDIGLDARTEMMLNNPISNEELEASKTMLHQAAKNTIAKKNIHIGVTQHILHKIKARAVRDGIPYQSFINQILHQYINGDLIYNNR